MEETDRQLVQSYLAGDKAAFGQLCALHGERILAYLVRCGFAQQDAEDLRQEVFIRLLRSLSTFDSSRGSFRVWLGAVTRNVARKRWNQRMQWGLYDSEYAEDLFVDSGDGSQEAQQREELAAVSECISGLPGELSRLVRLRYVEGMTTRGMAALLDVPESTLRLRLKEAHDHLELCLRGKGVLA